MTRFYKFWSLMMVVALAWSCGEEDNLDPLGNWQLTEATPSSPASNASIVLNEDAPAGKTRFEWSAAEASNRFVVQYNVVLVPAGSEDYTNPILSLTPGNGGKNLFVEATAQQVDYALWAACYPAGQAANLEWAVVSKAIDKQTVATTPVSITRFETEYLPETLFLTGTATEHGTDVAQAIPMRHRTDADGNPTYVFDAYTTLTAGATFQLRDQASTTSRVYGGDDETLEGCGDAIPVAQTHVYRVVADLEENTYDTMKIDRWSLVGSAVQGGWGGDVPLTYQGNGVWKTTTEFFQANPTDGFIFRANGDWGYLLKRVQGTGAANNLSGDVFMESEAANAGVTIEDMPSVEPGIYTVTLNLAADGYTYSLVKENSATPEEAIIGKTTSPDADQVSGSFTFGEYDMPDKLFLLDGDGVVMELAKDGTSFKSNKFLALQASKTYTLNDASDGSGTTYNSLGNGDISVARDQAYQLTVNFETGKLVWKYYNIKLFHWDEAGGGWDGRTESLMTYTHPYQYDVTVNLSAGFHSKFNSPWEVQFGTASTALSGTMTNGGANYTGIVQSGSYHATIVVSDDYSTATYTFVKQ